ncbi:zinc finger BED domain-containing protein 4-like [Rhopilema esculentum]|uniref:zinc finger BED domain-containing protein 4-like n=1 Tax=Rhopilema esculentum TaxID=499914 RepID=UPI0031DA6F57
MSHWLDEDFNYKSAMLNARHFPGRHTGGLIESNFNIMLGEWSIDHSRIQMLVRDGASNIALGARLSELDSIHCFINRLQLCIESSILSQRSVSDMCAKARKIVTHFHHSSQACTTFKNIQIENGSKQPLLLVQDVKMRWNSTFLMLQRLSILKATVQLYAGDNEIPILTANEWQLMDKVLRLLQPFFEITKKVSGEQSILSAVIPDVAALDRYLTKYTTKDSGVHTLKEELRQELKRRFFSPNEQELDVTYSKPYVVSTLLDPRFKGKFVSVKSLSNGRGMLLEDMKKAALVQKSAEEKGDIKNNTDEENCAPGHKKKKLETLQEEIHYDFSACYDEISEQNDHVLGSDDDLGDDDFPLEAIVRKRKETLSVPHSVLAAELERYVNMPCIPRTESPFLWWKQHKTTFPHIAKLAQQFLSTPASSVYSERLFSEAGNIFEEKRSRLLPRNGEKLLFLHHNLGRL